MLAFILTCRTLECVVLTAGKNLENNFNCTLNRDI